MNKKDIINTYELKIKELDEHNKLYYEKSDPKLSDSDYDNLKLKYSARKKIFIFK